MVFPEGKNLTYEMEVNHDYEERTRAIGTIAKRVTNVIDWNGFSRREKSNLRNGNFSTDTKFLCSVLKAQTKKSTCQKGKSVI